MDDTAFALAFDKMFETGKLVKLIKSRSFLLWKCLDFSPRAEGSQFFFYAEMSSHQLGNVAFSCVANECPIISEDQKVVFRRSLDFLLQ